MSETKTIILATNAPDEFEPAVSLLATKGIDVRLVKGTYRLAAGFATDPTDTVVLDLENLQQKDLEVIQILREFKPSVGIVTVTGPSQHDLAASSLCRGADIYLLKPFSGLELLEALERADRRRQLSALAEGEGRQMDALAKFALGIAHEINNPLTTISGWLQMLIADKADDKQLSDLLKSMKEESDRVAEVVTQLLTFAQQGPPRTDPVNMGRLLRELGRAQSARLKSDGIQLDMRIEPHLPPVSGDTGQLRRACDSILAESRAGLDSKGKIEVRCRPRDEGIEIVFLDNGRVIPKAKLAHIFEPFRYGRQEDGRGVGLCLAHGIVRSHGGTIEAESEEPTGTRFTVWLPAEQSGSEEP